MKYKVEDLDYIFIRAQSSKGHWDNVSLDKVSDVKFVEWITKRFGLKIKDDKTAKGTAWTPEQKVDVLNYISKKIKAPCVCMIKRTARDEFNKKK